MTPDPGEFTCMECLSAPAVNVLPDDNGEPVYICEKCIESAVADRLLDLVNQGEMRIAADGKSFESLTPEPKEKPM